MSGVSTRSWGTERWDELYELSKAGSSPDSSSSEDEAEKDFHLYDPLFADERTGRSSSFANSFEYSKVDAWELLGIKTCDKKREFEEDGDGMNGLERQKNIAVKCIRRKVDPIGLMFDLCKEEKLYIRSSNPPSIRRLYGKYPVLEIVDKKVISMEKWSMRMTIRQAKKFSRDPQMKKMSSEDLAKYFLDKTEGTLEAIREREPVVPVEILSRLEEPQPKIYGPGKPDGARPWTDTDVKLWIEECLIIDDSVRGKDGPTLDDIVMEIQQSISINKNPFSRILAKYDAIKTYQSTGTKRRYKIKIFN